MPMKKIIFVIAFLLIPFVAAAEKPVWITGKGNHIKGRWIP
jgi:hypothetical protein